MTVDPWASPGRAATTGWEAAPTVVPPKEPRLRRDLVTFGIIVVGMVLLAAPVGLLWSAVAPHYIVVFQAGQPTYPDIESTKAFIGADGTYVAVTFVVGLVTGGLGWLLARRSGPWTVAALALGGILAALVAARVGLLPGKAAAFDAIEAKKGEVELFLGARDGKDLHLRSPWAAVAWPVGALLAFVVPAYVRPEDLD